MVLHNVRRASVAFIVLAFAVAAGACGSHQNAPTAPSSSAAAAQPSGSNAASATISGTVVGVTAASQFKTERVNLTVTVTGTTSMTTVDDAGRFTLTNVPPGHIDLHFSGPGVDAHLALDVAERSTLVIVVRVAGNDARLDDNRGDADDDDNDDDNDQNRGEAEVKGTIAAGSLAGSCAASTLSFRIGSTQVKTNAATQFKDTTCSSLKAGDAVEVKGARQSDASILASRVERDR